MNSHKLLQKPRADDIRPYTIMSICDIEIACLTEVSPLEKTSLFYTRLKFHPGAIIFSLLVAKAVIK